MDQNFAFFSILKVSVHLYYIYKMALANPQKRGCQSQDVKSDKEYL